MEIKNKKTIINLYKYTIFVVFILFFISAIDTMAGISVNLLTENAKNITNTGATLRGTLNPGGFANVYFRYSPLEKPPVFCNDIYGSRMRATDEISISGNVKKGVSFNIVNLSPYTKYYYCIVGSNDSGIAYGGVKFFQTLLTSGISVTTKNALVVDSASAYLNGTYSATMPTETYFRLKKDGAEWQNQKFGLQQHSSGTGGSISYLLKELSPNTSYQFKAVISSKTSDEAIDGATLTFNTKSVGKIGPGTARYGHARYGNLHSTASRRRDARSGLQPQRRRGPHGWHRRRHGHRQPDATGHQRRNATARGRRESGGSRRDDSLRSRGLHEGQRRGCAGGHQR